ncbi:unnamed protein product [Schistosoma mattheei]|uniref:Uncharacterized protein n=1 Tax=Schistosoma mattheei TaxID=31246 RepID=A0A183NWI3_9TREM|nr:unnamed protein product [Schistosoma mattheei]
MSFVIRLHDSNLIVNSKTPVNRGVKKHDMACRDTRFTSFKPNNLILVKKDPELITEIGGDGKLKFRS